MPAHSRDYRVFDKIHRIGGAGVFREPLVVIIGRAAWLQHQIFQHRAKADGAPNLRLVGVGQLDALGVASSFKVEDAAVAPAMLVVADQPALRIGGERGLAGA